MSNEQTIKRLKDALALAESRVLELGEQCEMIFDKLEYALRHEQTYLRDILDASDAAYAKSVKSLKRGKGK